VIRKLPFALAVLSMSGGVFIAILFGVNEQMFLNCIQAGLEKNVQIQQIADPEARAAKIKSETEKNWRYYQRYHFHATGIGAMMMGLLLFLAKLDIGARAFYPPAYLISVGGLLYPFVWLFAGMYGPQMGRAEAKEAFAIFGYMGGLFLVGALWTLWLSLRAKPIAGPYSK
jgi:hypothetical protein